MDYWDSSTVPFQSVYGPAGGQGGGSSDQTMTVSPPGKAVFMGLEIPTLVALGVVTWWVIKKLD